MIKLIDISKRYGDKIIFENFNLEIEENKCTVILGESGSGKTTLANILLKLTDYEGVIEGNLKDVTVVFQNNMLAKNLTVSQNLLLVNPDCNVDEILTQVGLIDVKDAYIKTLSAGMQRRVAIARAMCVNAPVLILDEPFVNLDLALKYSLMEKIKNRAKEQNQTVIMITHDIGEAVTMADKVMILSGGQIVFTKDCIEEEREQNHKQLFDLMIREGEKDL